MSFLRILLAVLGLTLLGAAAGVALFWWTTRPVAGDREPIPLRVGGVSFRIPPAYVRAGALPRPGVQDRIDLALIFPGMQAQEAGGPLANIFLSIMREDGVTDPSERVEQIYGRFLEPDIWQNPGGLLLRRFTPDSPYGDEELFISPPDGRAFSARCRKPPAPGQARGAQIGETCLWRFRLGGADAQVRFSPDLLPQWEALATGLREKIGGWRP
jgi:hypothetical protein